MRLRLLSLFAICATPVRGIGSAHHVGRTPPAAASRLQEYRLDAGHSTVEFSVAFAFTHVKGRFPQTHGTILYDAARPESSSVTVVIESKSIDTGWPHRDEHLRTSDFFDVDRYPTIVFQSERVRRAGGGWIVEGPLTMHGVTRRVSIPFRLIQAPARSPESGWMMLNALGTTRIARTDFGILGGSTYNSWFTKARAATVADSVDIALELEGYLVDAVAQHPPPIDAALGRLTSDGMDAYLARLQALHRTKSPAEWANYFHGQDLVVRALLAADRTAEALALSAALPDLFPRSASAWLVRGYALSVAGDTVRAAAAFASARAVFEPTPVDSTVKFKQVDENWFWLDLLARTSVETGHPAAGLALDRVVVSLYPEIANGYATLGYLFAVTGDASAARTQYARAVALDPLESRALELRRRLPAGQGL